VPTPVVGAVMAIVAVAGVTFWIVKAARRQEPALVTADVD
jgi:hypothetical protein